jgi:hypothetical protein
MGWQKRRSAPHGDGVLRSKKKKTLRSLREKMIRTHTPPPPHRAAPLNNVANLKVLPVANSNAQLEIETGNWQH